MTSSASAAPDGAGRSVPPSVPSEAQRIATLEARLVALEAECRRLKLSERHFRTLIENSSDLVAVLDRKGAIAYCSPACERVLDHSPGELTKKNMHDILHPDDRERTLRSVGMFLSTPGAAIHREFRLKRRDGRWRHFEGTALNLLEDEAVRGIVINAHDITERVRMEQFFKASLTEKETLLKEIHHRVKNNLQLISSILGLQAHQIDEEAVAKIFRDSKDRIRSMALIHEQLYQSKNLADIGLAGYLTRLTRHLSASHAPKGSSGAIRFTQSIDDTLTLDIDRMIYLGLLVNEIVTNALKHAFPAGRTGAVTIEACEEKMGTAHDAAAADASRWLTLRISDTGVGLPAGVAIEGAQTLGLQLVSMLTLQLEGRAELASTPKGTTCTITIPLEPAQA